jgi:hypothetical protein
MNNIWVLSLVVIIATGACKTMTSRPSDSNSEFILENEYRSQWMGSPDNWRWEEGVLIGETTEENPIQHSSFLIWEREVENFILNVSFRISAQGNSGIYYRCEHGPEGYDELLGYQADIDGQHKYTGIVYENFMDRHRKILAGRGQFVRISESDSVQGFPISLLDHSINDLMKNNSWNKYELIVKGSLIVQKLNGSIVSMVEDRAENRIKKGLFGFQLHQGPPMKVEFRDAVFKDLNR